MAAGRLQEGKNVNGYGLKFLLDQCKMIGVAANVVQAVLEAICKINYYQAADLVEAPEGDDVTEEQKEKIGEQNEEIEKQNELFNKLKQYVKLCVPEPAAAEGEENNGEDSKQEVDETENEKCLVRIMNYRDPVNVDVSGEGGAGTAANTSLVKDAHASRTSAVNVADAEQNSKMDTLSETSSQRNTKQIESFELEKLSQKVILMKQ